MRITTAVAILLLVVPAWAKKEINPADYPLSAHVRSVSVTRMPTVGRVSNDSGETARVRAIVIRSTEVRVCSTIYTSDHTCPALKAGMDVPARVADKRDF